MVNEYRLKFTINALSTLEDVLKKPFGDVILSFASGRISINDLRALVYAGIIGGNKGLKSFTLEDAGNYIDEVGIGKVAEMISKAFEEAFTQSKEDNENGEEVKN